MFLEMRASGVRDERAGLVHERGKREAVGTKTACQVCISQNDQAASELYRPV